VEYEDRVSIETPEGVTLELTLAGLGSRFAAALVDQLIQWALIIALVLGAAAAGPDSAGVVVVITTIVLVFAIQLGYHIVFETLASGRSPGKRVTGLRVVRADGGPVGFMTSAVRNLVRLLDALPGTYLVGMVAVLANPRNQRLGDMAAGTLVVRERSGGRRRRRPPAVVTAGAPTEEEGVPAGPWATWDVSAVTVDEVGTVRRFLVRRDELEAGARARIAEQLAARLRPKVAGAPVERDAERFLESLVAAKASRG